MFNPPAAAAPGDFFARLLDFARHCRSVRTGGQRMQLSRRGFTAGALGFGAAGLASAPAVARTAPLRHARAIAAIRAYADAHRRAFNLPALTLGVSSPSGFSTVIDSGFANADTRSPITPATLFQIGSISKSFVAALLHSYAAQGRFALGDRISSLMPEFALPRGNGITVQHLLDHVAGLPGDAPLFPEGGLWTAYAPGAHWHYSNTGYDMLGKLAEHIGGKPLARLLQERMFTPLGMTRSRGAITGGDRMLYAQGYEQADMLAPWVIGAPLAPAAWVDVTFGAGSIGSTASDMNHYLRHLAGAVQGRGGFGLPPQQGLAFARHAVPSGAPDMRYGNGLMHVADKDRSYLHHTGGMVSFSSSFHVDESSGVGAFASATISAFAEYRPRKLTLFAVQALAASEAGQPLPAPPELIPAVEKPHDYIGRYSDAARSFEIAGAGTQLAIIGGGTRAPLQQAGNDLFRTLHPAFRDFSLKFERSSGVVTGAVWGPDSFGREGAVFAPKPHDPRLALLAGRYVNDSPWSPPVVIVERGGRLFGGTEAELHSIGPNLFRIGDEPWSPERLTFANFIDGRPQTFVFSGEKFLRHDI